MDPVVRAARAFLGEPVPKIRPLCAGTANRSFLAEDSAGNAYVLRRRSPRYADPAFAAFEAEYIAHLAQAGLPVPVLLNTPTGSPFLYHDGTLWQMSRYREGAPYDGSGNQRYHAGYLLARLHNAVDGFLPSHERICARYEHPHMLLTQYEQYIQALEPDAIGRKQLSWVPRLIETLARRLPDDVYERLPKRHIHGDYHSMNLLFNGDRVAGIFDFDRACLQARLRDIADGVIFFGSRRETPIDDRDIISLTQGFEPVSGLYSAFLQGYIEETAVPLTADEKWLLPCFIMTRFLGMRLDGMAKLPADKRVYMLERDVTQPLQWFERIEEGNEPIV